MITRESLSKQILDSKIIQAGLTAEDEGQVMAIYRKFKNGDYGPVGDGEFPLGDYYDLSSEDPDLCDDGVVLISLPEKNIGGGEAYNSQVALIKIFESPGCPYRVDLTTEPFAWNANGESELVLSAGFKNLDEALETMALLQNAENPYVDEYEWNEETRMVDTSPSPHRLEKEARWELEAKERAAGIARQADRQAQVRFDLDDDRGY